MKEIAKKNLPRNCAFLFLTLVIMAAAVWGPERLAEYQDKAVLQKITVQAVETGNEGYRYSLSSNEKLYILSKCLNNQILPESEQNALTRQDGVEMNYQELTGSYAFVVNYQKPSDKEITAEEIFDSCNESMALLRELGILPDEVKRITASAYDAVLYSAIDVLDPRNNLAVWKVSLSTGKRNADKAGRLIDAYIDADTGKLYEFYVRINTGWEELDPDAIVESWCAYMGLSEVQPYEDVNPLMETAAYYKKYSISGIDGENTVITIGFYEGINELFLKISR